MDIVLCRFDCLELLSFSFNLRRLHKQAHRASAATNATAPHAIPMSAPVLNSVDEDVPLTKLGELDTDGRDTGVLPCDDGDGCGPAELAAGDADAALLVLGAGCVESDTDAVGVDDAPADDEKLMVRLRECVNDREMVVLFVTVDVYVTVGVRELLTDKYAPTLGVTEGVEE